MEEKEDGNRENQLGKLMLFGSEQIVIESSAE